MKHLLISLLFGLLVLTTNAQTHTFFKNVILKVDTLEFSLLQNSLQHDGNQQLHFEYDNEDEVCEIFLFTEDSYANTPITLLPSGDFEVLDSLLKTGNGQYRFKIRFKDLNKSEFLKLLFTYSAPEGNQGIAEIPLFASTSTYLRFYPVNDELYIGEEKIFELVSNNTENIQEVLDWNTSGNIDYRLTARFNQIRLHVIPKATGLHTLTFIPKTRKPFISNGNQIKYELDPISYSFSVKQSRLRFLNIDRQEITFNEEIRQQGIEIQMDYQSGIEIEKTYRIENQEAPGGPLIAEIFVKSMLTNNRVLCILRTYNYHRTSQGYLYIKDGDKPRFITNFNITPKTTINKVSVLREGSEWSTNLNVSPGDVVDIRLEGEGLHKALFRWEDVENITPDSSIRNENLMLFKIRVPQGISKRRIELYNHGQPTGFGLNVREFQVARDFDFLKLNYGEKDYTVSSIGGMLIYDKTMRDILIDFDKDIIDSPQKLYGKQYLRFDLKITGRNGELIELQTIENIVVVPGDKSPRAQYYNRRDETTSAISLNKILKRKTFDLEDWAKIEITVQHRKEMYEGAVFKKDIVLYLQKPFTFDIDVSFPAGLLINTFGTSQYQNLGGISMAMIAQFSFADPDRPGKFKPYRVGAGFLALNTFDLSNSNTPRDMGLVVIGTLSPTRRDVKLTFPLYLGGGYKLNEKKWFVLLGPGIRVKL
jgi:hypothetical protein